MTQPNQSLIDQEVPTIELDGVKWPIPKLAPKQNEVIVPLVLKVLPKLMKMQASTPPVLPADADDATREAVAAAARTLAQENLSRLGEVLDSDGMRDLSTITFVALTKGHPDLTRADFDEMPAGTLDLVEAVMVIARQTGVIRTAKPGEKPLGEGQPA